MTRPVATLEQLTLFEVPHSLAIRVRQEQWPFAGLHVKREQIVGLVLEGGVIEDTDFEVGMLDASRWSDVIVRGCTFACERIQGLETSRVRFENCRFDGGRFTGGSLRRTVFAGCTFWAVQFDGTLLDDVRVEGGSLQNVTVESARLRAVRISTAMVAVFSGRELDVDELIVTGGEVERATLSGGGWRGVSLDAAALSGVEVTQVELSGVRATRCSVSNCSQSEGTLNDLGVEAPSRFFGVTFSGVTIMGLRLASVAEGSFLAVLRSVMRGFTVRDSMLIDSEFRASRIEAPARVDRSVLDGLDLRECELQMLAMNGGRLDGPVRVDGARIRRWTLDGTTLGESLTIRGPVAELSESDPRLSLRK